MRGVGVTVSLQMSRRKQTRVQPLTDPSPPEQVAMELEEPPQVAQSETLPDEVLQGAIEESINDEDQEPINDDDKDDASINDEGEEEEHDKIPSLLINRSPPRSDARAGDPAARANANSSGNTRTDRVARPKARAPRPARPNAHAAPKGILVRDASGLQFYECAGTNINTGEPCSREAKVSGLCLDHYNKRLVKDAAAVEKKRLSKKRDKMHRRAERERRAKLHEAERQRFIKAGIAHEDIHPELSSSDSDEQYRAPAKLSLPRRRNAE